jgi:polysaccharide export outer membrane protein
MQDMQIATPKRNCPVMKKLFLGIALAGSIIMGSGVAFAAPPASDGFSPLTAPALPQDTQAQYHLGPFDKITVKVYGQDKLGVEKVQIDASGEVVLPLIGAVTAGGLTAAQLSREIAARLGDKYLESPQVSVLIEDAVSQRITVTGAVIESGVFNLKGPTTLMQAVAMAKGPDNKTANTRHVAIFRQINGHNARAVFDLKAINAGQAQDPEVVGGDSIIVEGSDGKTFWHELVAALPGLAIFAYF